MSGGSYDYIYCRLKEECEGRMYDTEMDDMIRDLADVLHDLEWWQSADSSEDEYRATLTRFKAKWFKDNREERLKGYIDNQIGIVRNQLYALIGEPTVNAIVIPDNVTNGDMIKAVFPNAMVYNAGIAMDVEFLEDEEHWFNKDWWNAPYKAESEEIKND